jgi:hypothetical protein
MRFKPKYALPLVQMALAWAVMDWMWLYHVLAFNSWDSTPPMWFVMLRNIEAWRETGSLWLHARPAARIAEDLALIALGFFSLFVALTDFHLKFVLDGPRAAGRFWPWSVAAVLCNLGWFVGLVYFFGRDLLQTLRSSNSKSK